MPRSPKVILSHLRHNGCITEKEYEKLYQAVDTNTRWIPFGTDVPSDETTVLITCNTDGHTSVKQAYYNGEFWWLDDGNRSTIIAWMPLPEPYKAESEE